MVLVRVSVTVVPLALTAVTVLVALFISTAKSPAAGVPVTASLKVSVTVLVPTDAACAVIVGAEVSTLMARVPALLVLPAASAWVAESVSVPSPIAVMSPATKV